MSEKTIQLTCGECMGRFVLFPEGEVFYEMFDVEIAKHVAATHPDVDRPVTSITTEGSNITEWYKPVEAQ